MRADHLEIMVEEPSMEVFLSIILPKILGDVASFKIHSHRGKPDLMGKLEQRLRGYASWLPASTRIIVIVDRDDEDCAALKTDLETASRRAGLVTRSGAGIHAWRVVTRIAIEELEAWYFGEWQAVRAAYPRVSPRIQSSARYRQPDGIAGGTWEALERVLQGRGYFETGLRKIELAQAIGERFDLTLCASPSFVRFRDAVLEAIQDDDP